MNFSPALLSIGPSWVTDLITFVAIQALVLINGALQQRELLPTYINRKIIHIFAAPIFILWRDTAHREAAISGSCWKLSPASGHRL